MLFFKKDKKRKYCEDVKKYFLFKILGRGIFNIGDYLILFLKRITNNKKYHGSSTLGKYPIQISFLIFFCCAVFHLNSIFPNYVCADYAEARLVFYVYGF
uniref:Uncharacterized protein n=1 Tax=Cacopsylla melanoneura TaxID=428564 RepID=A0A8D9B0C2_9HEMI